MIEPHKGWNSRGYLPHFDAPDVVQAITFRLWDALPRHTVELMLDVAEVDGDRKLRARMEEHLNASYGACYLRRLPIAQLVQDALLYFDGDRYQLMAWVIMPNHVHVVVEMRDGFPLRSVVHSWKSYTAIQANRILGRDGAFWYPDYFDRYIRDEQHLMNAIRYVHENPVHAGLVERAEDWPFGSARYFP